MCGVPNEWNVQCASVWREWEGEDVYVDREGKGMESIKEAKKEVINV